MRVYQRAYQCVYLPQPKTVEELDAKVAKLELILQAGTFSWYTDRHGNYTTGTGTGTAAISPISEPFASNGIMAQMPPIPPSVTTA